MIISCDASQLTWLEFSHLNKHRKKVSKYQCSCGNITFALDTEVRSGHTKSCGCLQKRINLKHGHYKSPTYQCWADMKTRCSNPKHKSYKDYGGRGIGVCSYWQEFENFYKDMGDKPPGLTLERINNDHGYYRENCRWATRAEQNRNKRRTKNTKEVVLC